ncbi:DUF624 domain-containing protein [Youxingia wuxianensis]|uniref:DUF624 domain-containing protein n=1 Tax=Youxingia wuxianensis TaxID=2763678 RepID=A0A926IIU0_9FIRM|nr:DUF624 domain-containing protein [Youxingia wuxianensis]MBC8586018.1 DUF624 domain-containing protein [Youxingia wuxianensis]
MGFFKDRYSRPGPGIPKDAPKKKGLALYFEILWRELLELVKLNFLFLLFALPMIIIGIVLALSVPPGFKLFSFFVPLIFLGPVVTAMAKITSKMVRDTNHFLWWDFWGCFKADFKKGLITGLIVFGGMLLSASALGIYWKILQENKLLVVPFAIVTTIFFVLLLMSLYVFPMVSTIDLPIKLVFKNSFILSFVCLGYNILALLIVAIIAVLLLLFFPVTTFLVVPFFFSWANFTTTFCAFHGLNKYVIQGEDTLEKE